MDKLIWKSIREWLYFLGNVLIRVRVVFLPNCPLVLSLLKHRGVGAFFNKKMNIPNKGNLLYSSIDYALMFLKLKKWTF